MKDYRNLFFVIRKQITILAIRQNLARKKYELAIARIKSILSSFPDDLDLLDVAQDVYAESYNSHDYYALHEHLEQLYPDSLRQKRHFGTILIGSYRYEEALPKLIYCVENWYTEDEYSETLANIFARLAICYAYLENWELVDKSLQQATKADIWDPDIAYAHLIQLLGTNSSAKVQAFLDSQIKQHPRLHALYYWKALHLHKYLHDSAGSIQWYVRALNKASSFQPGERYWKFYLSTLEYSTPGRILKRVIEACVQQNKPLRALWLIYISKFTIRDSDIDIQFFRTYLNVLRNSFDVAEGKCRRMLNKNLSVADRIAYLSLLATIQSKQGKADDAILNINKALALDSEYLENWLALASFHLQVQDWHSAITTYRKALKMNPFDFKSWENLGTCYISAGDLYSAQTSYEKAVQLNPFEASAWIGLANVYLKLGKTDLAISAFENGLQYDWLDSEKRKEAVQTLEKIKSM